MMLGYVMDAKVTFAHERLKKALQSSQVISLRSTNHPPTTAGKPIRFFPTQRIKAPPATTSRCVIRLLGWP
jgi:hypothetical protein